MTKNRIYLLIFLIAMFCLTYTATSNGEELLTRETALQFIFPDGQDFKEDNHTYSQEELKKFAKLLKKEYKITLHKEFDKEFNFFIGYTSDGEVSHYAYIDMVPGKWGAMTYIIGITIKGKVIDMAVMKYLEKRGKPVKKRRFLDQFLGKGLGDRLKVKRGIRAVSGATVSSRGMATGVRKVLALFDIYYGQKEANE